MKIAIVFPGQGSQYVGMGKGWCERYPAAREVFEEADEALGESLSTLCWEGPEEDLRLTANTQPAILTASVAALRVLVDGPLEERGLETVVMAGHSLGEYSALVAAGVLEFADAVRLVRRRGELMQEAVPVGQGAMAAILGLEDEAVRKVVGEAGNENEVCAVANLNSPGQVVIAGHAGAVERAISLAQQAGARRAVALPVSAPFHSPLMAPAREGLMPYLEAVRFDDPEKPVVVNIDAAPVASGAAARDALVRQIDGPVRWVESVEAMATRFEPEAFVEVGPGNVLSGLVKRIARGTVTAAISEPDDIEKLPGGSAA